ncbi:MAG: diacylglycerol kinase family protein [Rhodomicrobiaceae bacterium]
MRVHAILNRNAGTMIGFGPEQLEKKLANAFAKAGHCISVETAEPGDIVERLQSAAGKDYDAIIIGGGDGSVNAAATALLGRDMALGILPLGTLNRLARDLDLPLDTDQAIKGLVTTEPHKIDVGEVNGRIFLCNSFIGLPPMVTARRQSLRGRSLAERLSGYLALPGEIARTVRRLALLIDDSETPRIHRALTVAVSNNPYLEEAHFPPKRGPLDTGRLGLYISKHRTIAQTIWLLLRASLGLWQGDPEFEGHRVRTLTINSKAKRLRVSNDGEVLSLETPLHYRIRPRALTILKPKNGTT